MKFLLLLSGMLCFHVFYSTKLFSQCSTPPAPGMCSGGNGAANNGQNINGGEVYWFTGTSTFASGVNLNGGVLRVCGNLTLSNINFNSGTIEILAGGTLNIPTGGTFFLNGNATVINRGTFNIARQITLQNSNNYLYNLLGATLNMAGQTMDENSSSSFFINNGTANIGLLRMQSQAVVGAVCLGLNSIMNLTSIVSNSANCITAPEGPACISYTGDAQLNQPLSATSNVKVCRATGSTTSGASTFGNAVVTNDCSGCALIFPPANDNCTSSTLLTINAPATNGTLANATPQGGGFSQNDVWYRFTPTCTLNHTISLASFTGADLAFEIYNTGCPASPGTGLLLTQNTGATSISETNTSSFIGGTTYYIRVYIVSGIAPTFTIRVEGFAPAQPAVFTAGNASPCIGTSNAYTVAAVANATSYNWTYPTGWSGSSTSNNLNATAAATTGNISVVASNCYGNSTARTFTVAPLAAPATPGPITAPSTVCAASTANIYSINSVVGATSYNWLYPTGWVGGNTGLSNSLTIGNAGNVSVTASNTCGTSAASILAVAPIALPPNPSGTISGITPNCDNTLLNYSNPSATIYWQTTASGTSTTLPTTAAYNVNTSGNYYVRSFNGTCWSTLSSAPFSVSIIASRPIFRSTNSGNWNVVSNWEMSTDGVTFVPACNYPVANNSDHVYIRNTHTILANLDFDIDKITIDVGGQLELRGNTTITLKNNFVNADLTVNGTLLDRCAAGNAFQYDGGATWVLGTNGTVIKTNAAEALRYKTNYEGGIANMVDGSGGAKFVYRYNGDGSPALVTMDMFYPNVFFENTTAAPYSFSGSTKSIIEGTATTVCTIKGNLNVGTTGTSAVTIYNNGENATNLFTILGNLNVAIGCTLTNASFDGTNPNGTGFEVKGNITVNGTFNVKANNIGTLLLTGTGLQILNGNNSAANNMNIQNCIVNNTLGITVDKDFNIFEKHTYNTNAKLTFGVGNITLKSNANFTAEVTAIPSNVLINYTGAGRFIVERFITASRKWRFLAVPANSTQTVRQSWMEGAANESQNPLPGFGMIVTDEKPTALTQGFDFRSISGPSVKYHNVISNDYTGIVHPNALLSSNSAYMVYVRGDRTCKPVPANMIANTILRTTGQLYRNLQTTSAILPGQFKAIGNPYASRIDLRGVYTNSTISPIIYLWDSKLVGAYGIGAFQTLTNVAGNFKITPGGGSYGASGTNMNTVESGQAFFVRAAATIGAVNINETDKISGSTSNVYRINNYEPPQLFSATLALQLDNVNTVVDGVMVSFKADENNKIDYNDGAKLININENVSIKKENVLLATEQMQPTKTSDTIHLNVTALRAASYQWQFTNDNFEQEGRSAFLVDKFLNTTNVIDIKNGSNFNFIVNANAASYAADRFLIIFTQTPITTISNITAERNNKTNAIVQWQIHNEINVAEYQLQKSIDAINYETIATKMPNANNATNTTYSFEDNEVCNEKIWYRVKLKTQNNYTKYSAVAMIAANIKNDVDISKASVTIAPNPIENNTINLIFSNQLIGNYKVAVYNNLAQLILQQNVKLLNNNTKAQIVIPPASNALYQVLITDTNGKKVQIPFATK